MALPRIHPDDLCILDACAGYGMLGEAVLLGLEALGLRGRGRIVCHIERDAAAAAALVARMEGSPVDLAPVWDDLATFDGRRWRGCVDIACAGLPCPAYSLAGKRIGNDDARAWGEDGESGPVPQFLRIIAECRPAVVFCENVPAWVTAGWFRRFGDELCRLGYEIEEPLFLAASDVKAPQERERVFILAYMDHALRESGWFNAGGISATQAGCGGARRVNGDRRERSSDAGVQLAGGRSDGRSGIVGLQGTSGEPIPADRYFDLGDAERFAIEAWPDDAADVDRQSEGRAARTELRRGELPLGDASLAPGSAGESGASRLIGRGEGHLQGCGELPPSLWLFPPGRGDESNPDHPDWWAWAAVAAMAPAAMPRVEQHLPALADGMARADELRIGGNGVVTLAAAYALATLLASVIDKNGKNERGR